MNVQPINRLKCSAIMLKFALALPILVALSVTGCSVESWPGGDPAVSPSADFYAYANGGWQHATAIPADRAGYSMATVLMQSAEGRVRDLLETQAATAGNAPGDEPGKVGAYYAAFMDEPRIEALGSRPLALALDTIRRAGSRKMLARLMGTANAGFQGSLFSLGIGPDSRDPDRHALMLAQGGLGLPSNAYLDTDGAALRTGYRAYAVQLLTLLNWPAPEKAADAVMAYERKIAEVSWTPAQNRDETQIYNPTTLPGLERDANGFPWAAYFDGAEIRPDRIVVVQRSAISALARLFAETPVVDLQAWAAFHLADNAAPDLSRDFADAWFDLHGRLLRGAVAPPPRWWRALVQVSGGPWKGIDDSRGAMGDAVGRLYVARWSDPAGRDQLRALTGQLKATLKLRIAASSWMSAETKAEALRKVDAYRIDIGAPDAGELYEGLVIRRDDLFGNVERATALAWAQDRARLNRPVDRALWSMTPQTVNAYHYAPFAQLVFTAALLQSPAFDPTQDMALTYGGIGAIIGHELTHGFDDVGRTFDHEGHARDWWAPADDAHFKSMAEQLVRLYSSCEAAPGLQVDGRLTLGENIADIGGLQLAFAAYHASLGDRAAPVIDGLTGDQRFFLGYALLRRGKRRPEALRTDIANDPHTPDNCRVNESVRNVDGWYAAFGIKAGDPLFLPLQARVRVW
jgi:putative endopeptidase